jgi:hypothetical protein
LIAEMLDSMSFQIAFASAVSIDGDTTLLRCRAMIRSDSGFDSFQ